MFSRTHPAPAPRMFSPSTISTQNADTLVDQADRDYDHQHYAEAAGLYRHALATGPQPPGVRTDLALTLWEQHDAGAAYEEIEKVLAANPDFAPALDLKAMLLLRGKVDLPGAIAVWEHLLAANPGYAGRERVQMLLDTTKMAEKRSK